MDLSHLIKFLRLIESINIDYMITGSIASILYGKPRLTQDMDLVIVLPSSKIKSFTNLFDLDDYYCPPDEAIEEALNYGESGHMNVIDQKTGFKIDLYPAGKDTLNLWGLQNKREVELIQNESAWVAPPEFVILKKLLYYKEGGSQKHLEDIKGMLAVSSKEIDKSIIEDWAKKLAVVESWRLVEG